MLVRLIIAKQFWGLGYLGSFCKCYIFYDASRVGVMEGAYSITTRVHYERGQSWCWNLDWYRTT